jgi:hypothetical protein
VQLKHQWLLLLFAGLTLLSVAAVVSEPMGVMEISQWVFSGGEAPRQSGPLAMSATIGQPVAGHSGAGTLTLSWGSWGSWVPHPDHSYVIYLPLVYY